MNTGTVIAAAFLLALAGPAAAQQQVSERARTSSTGTVEVHNTAGSVRVVAWDRNEVQVTGTLGRGAERVQVGPEGDRFVVRVVHPHNARNVRGSDLEVRVPSRKTVAVRTTSASVQVEGVTGAVSAHTTSGSVAVDGRPRDVEVVTRSGGVTLDVQTRRVEVQGTSGDVVVNGAVRERVEAGTVSGDVEIGAATGEVRVSTAGGDVRVRSLSGRADVATVGGDIDLRGRRIRGAFQTVSGTVSVHGDFDRGGTTTFNTHGGDVELDVPRGSGAELEITTFSGDILNEIEGVRVQRLGARQEYRLRVGGGGARVSVRTFSGNVRLTGQ